MREEWNKLLQRSARESFFLKWEWVYTFWSTIEDPNARLSVVACREEGRLVGVAPLYLRGTRRSGVTVKQLAFLGDAVASDYMDIIALPDYEKQCCALIMQTLQRELGGEFDIARFDGVLHLSAIGSWLRKSAKEKGLRLIVSPGLACPRAKLPSDPPAVMSGYSRSTRYDLRRKLRALRKTGLEPVSRHVAFGTDDQKHLELLFRLHRMRWDTVRGRDSTFDNRFRMRFNRELLTRLEPNDGLFSCMELDGETASILYVFRFKGSCYFYQNGWLPRFAKYSIGLLGVHAALEWSAKNHVHYFDFLRGPEPYKSRFADSLRYIYSYSVYTDSLRGRCLYALHRGRSALRTMRQGRTRPKQVMEEKSARDNRHRGSGGKTEC